MAMDSPKFRLGRPNLANPPYLWKLRSNENDVDTDEFEYETSQFYQFLSEWYHVYGARDIDLYPLGDEPGDRSHYLVIDKPSCLDRKLLNRIQEFLSSRTNWRVIIPTLLTKETHIVIYYDVVIMPIGYESEDGLIRLRDRMINSDNRN